MLLRKLFKKVMEVSGYKVYKKSFLDSNPLFLEPDLFEILRLIVKKLNTFDFEIIFDVGANIGQSATHFSEEFKNSRIYCFEPIEDTYKHLINTVSALKGAKNINCYNLGFGSKEGLYNIYLQPDSLWNSLSNNNPMEVGNKCAEVKITTLDQFCSYNEIEKIDLIKIDVEGYELEVLRGCTKLLDSGNLCIIALEVGFLHDDLQHSYFPKIHEYLIDKNYNLFGFYEQTRYQTTHGLGLGFCNALYLSPKLSKHVP